MEKKNKAARAVNTALGLIVIISVILFSPLFGYARGFSTAEQRQPAAANQDDYMLSPTGIVQNAAATPRPTPQPTPTPVVLPSAPPAPDPTPVPTPRPVAVQQPVPQPVQPVQQQEPQQAWTPETYWEGEGDGYGYDADAGAADAGYEQEPSEPVVYEGLGEGAENGVISTESADIVINADMGGGEADMGGGEAAVDYSVPFQQDNSEGEAYTIG